MTNVKCTRCGGTSSGTSFDDASINLNHASGLSRGIPCGSNYNRVVEVKDSSKKVESKSSDKIKSDDVKSKSFDKPKHTDKPKTSRSY